MANLEAEFSDLLLPFNPERKHADLPYDRGGFRAPRGYQSGSPGSIQEALTTEFNSMIDEREATVRRIYKLLAKVRELKMIARGKKNEHVFKFSWIEAQLRSELKNLDSPMVNEPSHQKLFEKLDKTDQGDRHKKQRGKILPFRSGH